MGEQTRRTDLDELFAALSDPTRRAVLELLAANGELRPKTLGARTNRSRAAIAQHLAVLEAAGLIARSSVGRTTTCTLNERAFAVLRAWLDRVSRTKRKKPR